MSIAPDRDHGLPALAAPMSRVPGMAPELGETLGLVLAGGAGTRLYPLTRSSCKPALPFAGQCRLIDLVLSNCLNSGLRRIGVLTQHCSELLVRHVNEAWPRAAGKPVGCVEAWPAARGPGAAGYSGTADAFYRNLDLIRMHAPADVLVLAADHVYRMGYAGLVEMHRQSRASVTVPCVEVPVAEAVGFGVVSTDAAGWIETFTEKPAVPRSMPGRPYRALASMGVYVFDADFLYECLEADARTPGSAHDFGRAVLPAIIGGRSAVLAAPLQDPQTGAPGYWRDVGTTDSYWQAHMDLLEPSPRLEVDAPGWPLRATLTTSTAPRFTGSGFAERSIVSSGSVVAGAVRHSVLARGARVGAGTIVEDSVTLENVRIGRGCRISRAVIDAGTTVPDGAGIAGDAWSMNGTQRTPGRVVVYSGRRSPGGRMRRCSPRVSPESPPSRRADRRTRMTVQGKRGASRWLAPTRSVLRTRMPSRRIVVVDDDREVAAAFGAVLRDLGHSVEFACDAHHALQIARTLRPSIAFVDLVMPDVDGHELARRFREEYSRGELVLIAVTGFANEAFLAHAESAFDACLAKPVAIDALVELMTASPPASP